MTWWEAGLKLAPLSLCQAYLTYTTSVALGAQSGIEECKFQFAWERWNCPENALQLSTHNRLRSGKFVQPVQGGICPWSWACGMYVCVTCMCAVKWKSYRWSATSLLWVISPSLNLSIILGVNKVSCLVHQECCKGWMRWIQRYLYTSVITLFSNSCCICVCTHLHLHEMKMRKRVSVCSPWGNFSCHKIPTTEKLRDHTEPCLTWSVCVCVCVVCVHAVPVQLFITMYSSLQESHLCKND